jgi:hypothetical protein
MALVGGHPYLIRLLMHRAALQATPLTELLDASLGPRWILTPELRRLRAWLRENSLYELTARVAGDPACQLDSGEVNRLVRAGVVLEGAPGPLRLRDGLHAIATRALA